MSLRTKVNGFTAWINIRLKPYNMLLNNVVMDLLKGTNLKILLQSMTGIDNKKLQSFDGLTQVQKTTRVEWIVKELKESEVIPEDVFVDCRLFAMRHADHLFDLLWRLATHDIVFTWQRMEYLMHNDDEILCQIPFEWTPQPPPEKKKRRKVKYTKSLLAGFGGASMVAEPVEPSEQSPSPENKIPYVKYLGEDYVRKFKRHYKSLQTPDPDDCILEIVNTQLVTTREGAKLNVESLDDLVDSRVLCALVNSFAPGTFTTEVMLNDRWTINLALRTYEKIMRINTPVDSQDLAEANTEAICAYMCVYFMCGFKLRQARAVVNRIKELEHLIRVVKQGLETIPTIVDTLPEVKKRKELRDEMDVYTQELQKIKVKYDIKACGQWLEHVDVVQAETRDIVAMKMRDRFDTMILPRSVTINDLCLTMVINLNLTNGGGFYLLKNKETVTPERRLVLRDLQTGEFLDDFTHGKGPPKVTMRKLLHLHSHQVVDINPSDYQQYEIFVESASKNKVLKSGSVFLYQIFPGNFAQWESLFFKACKIGELDTVQKLVVFFRDLRPGFINAREKKTLNTPTHMAARNGHFNVLLYLLENGGIVDAKNSNLTSPFFNAVEGLNKGISQMYRVADMQGSAMFAAKADSHENSAELLVEWGANIYGKNKQSKTAFDVVRSEEQKVMLVEYYDHLQNSIPRLMRGDTELLSKLVEDHITGARMFASLRSRFVNGSTLLHTAAYFGALPVLKVLLRERVDVNLLDYKGATPLHRARDPETMRILMENDAKLNAIDGEGNTPLHVKCYGEAGQPSQLDCIEELLTKNIDLGHRNNKELLAIHCCAMQGRIDAIELLLNSDPDNILKTALEIEDSKTPPSLTHLAFANDFLECGQWLVENGFNFKEHEQDILVHRLLTEQIKSKHRLDIMRFLFEHGADLDQRYAGGNSPLHYAAAMTGPTDILELLVEYGADIDAINDDHCTPLFFATQANNYYAASALLHAGANVRHKSIQGLTAFDCIIDFDEWLECGFFTDEIKARLKAYSLKHARDLVRAITQKVRGGTRRKGLFAQMSAMTVRESPHRSHAQTAPKSAMSHSAILSGAGEPAKLNQNVLPPLKPKGFLTN